MAQLTITVPDAAVPRIVNAFEDAQGPGPVEPVTQDTIRQYLISQLRDFVLRVERQQAAAAAADAVEPIENIT